MHGSIGGLALQRHGASLPIDARQLSSASGICFKPSSRPRIAHEEIEIYLPNKWAGCIHHHRQTQLALDEHISYRPASHRQESRARKTVKEARDEHSSDIGRNGTGDQPDDVKEIRPDEDGAAAVELWTCVS